MENRVLQSFASAMLPPSGVAALASYIAAAVRAVGVKSDAELARSLGIPPTHIANWKRRGEVPAEQHRWLSQTLLARILHSKRVVDQEEAIPIAAVIFFLLRKEGDALELRRPDAMLYVAHVLDGLIALSRFLHDGRGEQVYPAIAEVRELADLLEGAVPELRREARVPLAH